MVTLAVLRQKADEFLLFLEKEKNVSYNTFRAYRADLAKFFTFWETLNESTPLDETGAEYALRRYIVSLFYDKALKVTVARKLSCFRTFSHYLSKEGIKLEVNVKTPRRERRIPKTLSVDEITYLLDSITIQDLPSKSPYRDRAVMEMLYATGVRCSELTHMRFQDIDMQAKTVRVLGKGRRERIVLFGEKAKQALIEYIEGERSALGALEPAQNLFVGPSGKKLAERTVQRICEMYRRLLKIERPLTPHKMRHSFATHLLHQGVDLRVIQELLGHSSLATVELYTHVASQDLARMCDDKHPLNTIKIEKPAV